jgi:predicted nucleic acid-binding protein
VHSWFRREPERKWATCPLTQAGFARVAGRALGGHRADAAKALAGLELDCRSPHHEFWVVDIDLRDLSNSQRSPLIGANRITDMQLLMLAHRHRGQLATCDIGLEQLASGTCYANSLLLL